jgi:hypothetical protein
MRIDHLALKISHKKILNIQCSIFNVQFETLRQLQRAAEYPALAYVRRDVLKPPIWKLIKPNLLISENQR